MSAEFKEVGLSPNHRTFVITLEDGTIIEVLYSTTSGAVTTLNHGRLSPNQNKAWTAEEILKREA